jgi:hypothetical protein
MGDARVQDAAWAAAEGQMRLVLMGTGALTLDQVDQHAPGLTRAVVGAYLCALKAGHSDTDQAAADPMSATAAEWHWRIDARVINVSGSPGASIQYLSDEDNHGAIEAEGSGGALQQLLDRGPWDLIDQNEEVTIELRPVSDEPRPAACGDRHGVPQRAHRHRDGSAPAARRRR